MTAETWRRTTCKRTLMDVLINITNTLVFSLLFLKTRRGRFGGTIWCAGCSVPWVWCASWWHMSTTVWMWLWPTSSPPACSGGTTPWPIYRSEHRAKHRVTVVCVRCVFQNHDVFTHESGLYFSTKFTCQHNNVLPLMFKRNCLYIRYYCKLSKHIYF